MFGFLHPICRLIAHSLSPETTICFGGNAGKDGFPAVLGPREWSNGLLASMADNSTAWYFDRHRPLDPR
jgi:hypothetical protein